MKIKTPRVILRNYRESDIDDYWEYVTQANVGPRCGWPPYTKKEDAVVRLKFETTKPLQFCIEFEGKVIGSVELMEFNPQNEQAQEKSEFENLKVKEAGILLNENFWGKGIMTEALQAVVKFGFDVLHLDVIVAGFFEPNKGSWRVQEKSGFHIFKTTPNFTTWYLTGQPCDIVSTKITKDDFEHSDIYKNLQVQFLKDEKGTSKTI